MAKHVRHDHYHHRGPPPSSGGGGCLGVLLLVVVGIVLISTCTGWGVLFGIGMILAAFGQ